MTFIIGVAATVASVIIFCGSVWLLLALIMGSRLAYLVTAAVTLSFVFIMGLVWMGGDPELPLVPWDAGQPLGPVSEQPSWNDVGLGEDTSDIEFGPAGQYPGAPWAAAGEDDDAAKTQAAELESAAVEFLQEQIDEGKTDAYETSGDAVVKEDTTLLTEVEGEQYGALTLEPATGKQGDEVIVVMSYDPGNPFQMARFVTIGSLLLLILHLVALSRAEARSKRTEATA